MSAFSTRLLLVEQVMVRMEQQLEAGHSIQLLEAKNYAQLVGLVEELELRILE